MTDAHDVDIKLAKARVRFALAGALLTRRQGFLEKLHRVKFTLTLKRAQLPEAPKACQQLKQVLEKLTVRAVSGDQE